MKSSLRFSFFLFLFLTFFGQIIFATNPTFESVDPPSEVPQMCAFELGPIELVDASGYPNDNTLCDGDVASMNATFLMVGQVSTWSWTTNASAYVTINNASSSYASISVQNPGITTRTAQIQLVATDANGCAQSKTIQITINPQFSISITERDQSGTPNDKGICFGDEIEYRVNRSGGKPPFTYDWNHLPASTNNTVVFNPIYDNTVHVYYVTVTDANGCEAVGFESAKGFTEIIATQTAIAACLDDRNEFVVSGGVPTPNGYLFFKLPSISATAITFSPASIPVYGQSNGTTQTYSFRIKDEKGCYVETQASLTTPPDSDNDGYRADCDCNDNDPTVATNCSLSISCPANQTVTSAVGASSAMVTYNQPTGTTPCASGGFSVQKLNGLSSGANFPLGTSTVTYQATDNCGGQATCSFSITVNQGQSGGGCAGNLLQNPGFESSGSWNGLTTTTSQTRTGSQSAEICGPSFNRIFGYANVDPNQQYSFKVWTKTTGTGSNGITLKYFSSGWQVLQNDYQNLPNSTDWQEQTMTKTAPNGAAFVEVSIIRNSGSGCIYVDDACFIATSGGPTGILTLACPTNITETAAAGQSTKVVTYTNPTASSTCPSGSVTLNNTSGLPSGTAFSVGTSTVSFSATDGCSNLETCSFTVTVLNGGSGGTCSNSMLVNDGFESSAAWNGLTTTSSNPHTGTSAAELCAPGFSRVFQYVAANGGQNYSLNFWAKETGAGSDGYTLKFFSNSWNILANEYKTINTSSTWQEYSFSLAAPAGTAFVEVSFFRNGGTGCLNIDDVCLALGSGGNNGNLTIQCPDNQTITASISQSTAVATYADPTANSTCTTGSISLSRTDGLASGAAFPLGTNQVTYQATDGCSNLQTCSFTITANGSGSGNSDCDNITFSGSGGQITINNLPNKIITMQVFNKANYSHVFQCFNTNCNNPTQIIPNVASGTYDVKIDIYEQNGGWQYVCQRRSDVSVSANLVASDLGLSLSAKAAGTQATLQWTSIAMSDADIFILERASNDANFEVIQEFATHVPKGDFIYLEEVDDAPKTGLNKYRIRQVSALNEERISDVQRLNYFDTKSVLLYPNPTSDWLNLDFGNASNETLDVRLIDRFGRVIFSQKMQTGDAQKINLTSIQEGIYALSIEFGTKRRIIKQVSILR